jgi:hypothetical protein
MIYVYTYHICYIAYNIACYIVSQTFYFACYIMKIYYILGVFLVLANHTLQYCMQYGKTYDIAYNILFSHWHYTILYYHIVCHNWIILDCMSISPKMSYYP